VPPACLPYQEGLSPFVSFPSEEVFDNGGPGENYQNGTLCAPRSRFQGSKMDILVADDDSSGRFLLNSTLVELGHRVTEVGNGCDAWEAWKRERHQLVISDWMMPGIDGL
jgi:PleD family two-component response regulator